MRNIKRKHLLFALSALLSICFYACYDGEEWGTRQGVHRVSPTKRNKQLTTSVARQWYESHYDPVVSVSTRSGGGDELPALIKPKWANATERNRGRYEVVQMPILTRTRRIIVDEDTRLHFDELRMQKKLRNSTHLVILKDLKTGNIRSFISVFVGSYDYLKKTKRMSRNSYLYREKDFDGEVLFFKLNGSMINGWKYRDGKIVGKITPIDEDTKILMTRSGYWEEECRIKTNYEYVEECEDAPEDYYWDEEYGMWAPVIRPPICEMVEVPIDTRVCEYVWVEGDDDDIEGGVEPDDSDASVCPICGKKKCRVVHDECDKIPQADETKSNVSSLYGIFSNVSDTYGRESFTFDQFEEALRTNGENENSATLYCYPDDDGPDLYLVKDLITGDSPYKVDVYGGTSYAVATIHNHPNDTPPSGIDILTAANHAKENSSFQTAYVYTSDGIYAVSIEDRQKAVTFYDKYHESLSESETAMFKPNSDLDGQWKKSMKDMNSYQGEDSHLLSLADLLRVLDSGMSISKYNETNQQCSTYSTYAVGGQSKPVKCE